MAAAAATAAAGTVSASQASSHFQLEPISAAVLCRRETKRRDVLKKRGPVKVGCRGVDDYVLMGGFERGSVVGVSAESEQMGLLMALQGLANDLCSGVEGAPSRAMVITTQPPTSILPTLRDAVKAELTVRGVPQAEVKDRLMSCLERVSVSRVFDLDGLWEVLGDLDIPPGSPASDGLPIPEDREDLEFPAQSPSEPEQPELEPEPERIVLPDLKPARTEIADSEDDEYASSLPPPPSSFSSELSPPPSSMASMLATPEAPEAREASDVPEASDPISEKSINATSEDSVEGPVEGPVEEPVEQPTDEGADKAVDAAVEGAAEDQKMGGKTPAKDPDEPVLPDIILMTHFYTLMTALFHGRDRGSAHDSLQDLSAHLRYLSRNLPTSPLIMLLNSTCSSKSKPLAEPTMPDPPNPQEDGPPPPPQDERPASNRDRPVDPTLRSIFNPPPLNIPGYINQAGSRRNKPTFGLIFSQLLDLHILCTRVPRAKEDAERLYAPADDDSGVVRYIWVIEVLLDEMGVWEEGSAAGSRRGREQRWTPVDARAGRIVDAFVEAPKKTVGEVRVVGGFGGPRV